MTRQEDRKIKELLDKFDFEIVRNAMLLKGWTWWSGNKTPTINELKHAAKGLLIKFLKTPNCGYYGSGGLAVEKEYINKKESVIKLTFTLESQYL